MEHMQGYLPVKVPRKGESVSWSSLQKTAWTNLVVGGQGRRKRMYPVGIQALVRDPWEVKTTWRTDTLLRLLNTG